MNKTKWKKLIGRPFSHSINFFKTSKTMLVALHFIDILYMFK